MGTVWSAYDEFLHRPVAVKEVRLPSGVPAAQADEVRERTLREARAIAVLSHPNVITLHDVAREHGEPFVVMELLPSRSLGALLGQMGNLDDAQAAAVADAVAAALEAAHAAGITHRDVKPGNVLVASDGRIKLTDFGIARNVSEVTMTGTGMMLGSPAYIAPEVATGGAVTPAADLWGLGATLFAAIEGHPPYDADGDPLETVGHVVNGAVPRAAPGPLGDLIADLMRKDPAERASLSQVRATLHPLLTVPRERLFDAALFASGTPDAAGRLDVTDTQTIEPVVPAEARSERSAELAGDPGPLPFATGPARAPSARDTAAAPVPAGRGAAAATALVLAAVLLFAGAGVGGFALTRAIGGADVSPPAAVPETPFTPVRSPQEQPFVTRTGDATNLNGAKGGAFSAEVPEDWARFVTQRPKDGLPSSTLVQFVSPDGTQVLGVERFADYYSAFETGDYAAELEKRWRPDDFVPVESDPPADGTDAVELTYNTVERISEDRQESRPDTRSLNRTTFARAFRAEDSLWVASITVPTEQQVKARVDLYERIIPTFRQTG
ncbi:serine/threonine-protein kinase [Amycolatopsis antarctica]